MTLLARQAERTICFSRLESSNENSRLVGGGCAISAFIAVLIKRFVQKHHSRHQDQQTAGCHHQQSHGHSVCHQTEYNHADRQKAGISCTE